MNDRTALVVYRKEVKIFRILFLFILLASLGFVSWRIASSDDVTKHVVALYKTTNALVVEPRDMHDIQENNPAEENRTERLGTEFAAIDHNEIVHDGNSGIVELPSIERNTRDIETLRNQRVMLITFDDGPAGDTTSRLLDELAKRDIRVTFFVLGTKLNYYADIAVRAHREGHTVSSHGYSHREFTTLSDEEILYEVSKTNILLYNLLGVQNRFIRAPYGSSNPHIRELVNMPFIFWNVDTLDWRYRYDDVVYQNIMYGAQDGAILLLHDLYETTVDGVLRAIDSLLSQGYVLISLEEAEALGYIDPNSYRIYISIR
ncbi:MAG: polysaccharide deacetylase family protein [Oscillospiraceae bacterium]|nr:polysaccharide deacetylase family protein [Oscillospiraceae bacterium]